MRIPLPSKPKHALGPRGRSLKVDDAGSVRLRSSDWRDYFDTNCFVQLGGLDAPPFKHIGGNERIISETVAEELDRLSSAKGPLGSRSGCRVLRFRDLHRKYPEVCPLYYFNVMSMYNPALLGDDDFYHHLHYSKIVRGQSPTPEEIAAYKKIAKRKSSFPERNDSLASRIQEAQKRTLKKAKQAFRDGHPSYLNDVRTLAMFLCLAVLEDKNLTFYTADGDVVSLALTWFASMMLQSVLKKSTHLGEADKADLLRGGTITRFLQFDDVIRDRHLLFLGVMKDGWKRSGSIVKIKLWNHERGVWEEPLRMILSPQDKSRLLKHHGSVWCHTAVNNANFNWARFLYFWPPSNPSEDRVRIEISAKPVITQGAVAAASDHDSTCSLRLDDCTDELARWSQFLRRPGGAGK